MTPLDIPGYVEAVQHERLVRDAAFLNLPERVAGFELRQMTLRDYITLRLVRSPILHKDITPAPEQLSAFLWFMSVHHSTDADTRRVFMRGCRFFQPPRMPVFQTLRAMGRWETRKDAAMLAMAYVLAQVRIYVAETMQDRPYRLGVSYSPSYYSDAAFWCALLGRECHQRCEDTLNMPLKQLFQFLKEIRETKGTNTASLGNPSDRVSAEYCARMAAPTN